MLYFESNQGRPQAGVENGAMLTRYIQIDFRMHHFVVKFLKIFFASGGKGALTP